jgi:hypothetical protein
VVYGHESKPDLSTACALKLCIFGEMISDSLSSEGLSGCTGTLLCILDYEDGENCHAIDHFFS